MPRNTHHCPADNLPTHEEVTMRDGLYEMVRDLARGDAAAELRVSVAHAMGIVLPHREPPHERDDTSPQDRAQPTHKDGVGLALELGLERSDPRGLEGLSFAS